MSALCAATAPISRKTLSLSKDATRFFTLVLRIIIICYLIGAH